jgi:ferredoxin
MKQFDERDTLFARMAWRRDSEAYKDYYKLHPEKLLGDEKLRALKLKQKEHPTVDQNKAKIVDAAFEFLADMNHFSEGQPSPKKTEVDIREICQLLKDIAGDYGADLVGIAKVSPEHYYSHRGRTEEHYGETAERDHQYAIVFAVEMDSERIDLAPAVEESIETSRIYVKAAMIGMVLSYYIRSLGYDARNHMDANYLLPLPPLAEQAGLGEMGRIGFLVTKDYGPRVRLGAVTTNLELIADDKHDFGIREYCESCHLCENACLGHAIASENSIEDDRYYWQTNGEKCYEVWKRIGTDCGVCMKVCPLGRGQLTSLRCIYGLQAKDN